MHILLLSKESEVEAAKEWLFFRRKDFRKDKRNFSIKNFQAIKNVLLIYITHMSKKMKLKTNNFLFYFLYLKLNKIKKIAENKNHLFYFKILNFYKFLMQYKQYFF